MSIAKKISKLCRTIHCHPMQRGKQKEVFVPFYMFMVTYCAFKDGLDTDSFFNAFFRMAYRRSQLQEVTSDNGTNFVGANTVLIELISILDKSKTEQAAANNGIIWHFKSLLGPYFGCGYKNLIKRANQSSLHCR